MSPVGERERIQNDQHWVTGAGYFDTFNPTGYTLSDYTSFTSYNRIVDNPVRVYHSSGLMNVKHVLHEQVHLNGRRLIPDFWSLALPEMIHTFKMLPPAVPSGYLSLLPSLDSGTLSDLCRQAFVRFSTQFPEVVGLGNFLLELKELKGLFPKLSGDLGKDISSAYLIKEFGVEPLLSDLRKLAGLVTSVEKRLQFLRDTWGKPTRLGFYKRLEFDLEPHIFTSPVANGPHVRYVPTTSSFIYRAGGTLYQKLEDLDSWGAYLRAFLGTTGLTNPIKIIWNAIPYSFIAGWLTDIGSRVDSLNVQQATPNWQVLNTSHTVEASTTGKLYLWSTSPYNPGPQDYVQLADVRVKRYERSPGLPTSPTELGWTGLDPKQLALILAMVAQRA